jgi:hypothetical protein
MLLSFLTMWAITKNPTLAMKRSALNGVATSHHKQCRLILDRFEKGAQAVFSL